MDTLDANIFVRDADPNAPEQATCRHLREQLAIQAIPIVVSLFVLVEVSGALSRALRDPIRARLVVDALQALPTVSLVPLDATLATDAANIAADRALRGADAFYVAVAHREGCQLVTLDNAIRSRAGLLVPVQTPAEALAGLSTP